MVPKLVAEDIPLLFSLLSDVFPGVQYHRGEMTALREELRKVCQEMYLTYGDGEEVGGMWVEKVTGLVVLGAVPTDPLAAVTTAAGHREETAKAGGHITGLSRFVPRPVWTFPQLKCRESKTYQKIPSCGVFHSLKMRANGVITVESVYANKSFIYKTF